MAGALTAGTDGLLAAIDIGGTKVKIALADATGHILGATELASGPELHAAELLKEVRARLIDLAAATRRPGAPIAAAGIVSPGVVATDGVGLAPNNPGMADLSLAAITDILGLDRVQWANDVKAAAWAEHTWGSLRGSRCGLYINLGTGLAAGLVLDGRPVTGAHGAALEIGYLLPSGSYGSGHRSGSAPLEDLISGRALQDRARARGLGEVRASDVLATLGADTGGPLITGCQELAEEFVDQFTRAVVNLCVAFDADAVSIGGGIAEATDVFLDPLRAKLDEYAPFPPRLTLAQRPGDSSLFGALRLALDVAGIPPEDAADPFLHPLPAVAGSVEAVAAV